MPVSAAARASGAAGSVDSWEPAAGSWGMAAEAVSRTLPLGAPSDGRGGAGAGSGAGAVPARDESAGVVTDCDSGGGVCDATATATRRGRNEREERLVSECPGSAAAGHACACVQEGSAHAADPPNALGEPRRGTHTHACRREACVQRTRRMRWVSRGGAHACACVQEGGAHACSRPAECAGSAAGAHAGSGKVSRSDKRHGGAGSRCLSRSLHVQRDVQALGYKM